MLKVENRRCPKCGSMEGQVKTGFDKRGSQRCICRICNYNYTLNHKYSEELKKEAIRLYKSGKSGREVAKILNVNKGSVMNWVRKFNEGGSKSNKEVLDGEDRK